MKFRRLVRIAVLLAVCLLMVFLISGCESTDNLVDENGDRLQESNSVAESLVALLGSRKASVQVVALLTILSLAPSILMMFTCFTRVIITLSFTKNALGMQQMPPSAVLVGLALILTFFIMSPVVDDIREEAYQPYVEGAIDADTAAERAIAPIKRFMLSQTYTDELDLFIQMSGETQVETVEEVPLSVVTPAFVVSELRRSFMIGFFIYIPFIVIDMIVASVLMSMGMMMLPPTVISLPFKVLLFVVVDGWSLVIKTLVESFM